MVSCLTGISHLTVGAGQLVHSALLILTLGVMFHGEALADCVIRGKRDCYICVFEKFGDEPGFFPTYVNLAHLRF